MPPSLKVLSKRLYRTSLVRPSEMKLLRDGATVVQCAAALRPGTLVSAGGRFLQGQMALQLDAAF